MRFWVVLHFLEKFGILRKFLKICQIFLKFLKNFKIFEIKEKIIFEFFLKILRAGKPILPAN